jgi:cyclic pyranopterin phosphate synthase
MLEDAQHRRITYLRLSVTDRCNLRCRYCMTESGVRKIDHEDILTYEEFLRVVKAMSSVGVTKVRVTGGEPLVRKGILDFLKELNQIEGLLDLRLTTNGVLLSEMAGPLLDVGVRRVNVSLDSLRPGQFQQICGRDVFEKVWNGIETALDAGFEKVKINTVVIRGFNDNEILDFVKLSMDRPLEVRFIEFMPIGMPDFWSPTKVVSAAEIKETISELGELQPVPRNAGDGPARMFRLPGSKGAIGFISALTDHFCDECNRLRLTADGKLRLCLLRDIEVDLKSLIRGGADQKELAAFIRQAVKDKPKTHPMGQDLACGGERSMHLIGG